MVIASALYGSQWRGKVLNFVMDNVTVVQVLSRKVPSVLFKLKREKRLQG